MTARYSPKKFQPPKQNSRGAIVSLLLLVVGLIIVLVVLAKRLLDQPLTAIEPALVVTTANNQLPAIEPALVVTTANNPLPAIEPALVVITANNPPQSPAIDMQTIETIELATPPTPVTSELSARQVDITFYKVLQKRRVELPQMQVADNPAPASRVGAAEGRLQQLDPFKLAAGKPFFAIQVASYESYAEAVLALESLQRQSVNGWISAGNVAGKPVYRLQFGHYLLYSKAQQAAAKWQPGSALVVRVGTP